MDFKTHTMEGQVFPNTEIEYKLKNSEKSRKQDLCDSKPKTNMKENQCFFKCFKESHLQTFILFKLLLKFNKNIMVLYLSLWYWYTLIADLSTFKLLQKV